MCKYLLLRENVTRSVVCISQSLTAQEACNKLAFLKINTVLTKGHQPMNNITLFFHPATHHSPGLLSKVVEESHSGGSGRYGARE